MYREKKRDVYDKKKRTRKMSKKERKSFLSTIVTNEVFFAK